MGVQACRLPALKRLPLKPLKPCKLCKSFSERQTAQATAAPRPHPLLCLGGPAWFSPPQTLKPSLGMLHPAASRSVAETERMNCFGVWLMMGVSATILSTSHRPQAFSTSVFAGQATDQVLRKCSRFRSVSHAMLLIPFADGSIAHACFNCNHLPQQLRWHIVQPPVGRRRHSMDLHHSHEQEGGSLRLWETFPSMPPPL